MSKQKIAIWLPSPMGDAIMATPALRAFRQLYADAHITFLANPVCRQVLTPNNFCDDWLGIDGGVFDTAKKIRAAKFDTAILLKNSFSCALAIFLAGIKNRVGYARDGRTWMLTNKINPKKIAWNKFKPGAMVDYYLTIAEHLGANFEDKSLELTVDDKDYNSLLEKLPVLNDPTRPIVVLVPGGAFGPSKQWHSERFAKTADTLIEQFNATVVISIAPNETEKQIADSICEQAHHPLISLGNCPVNLRELKALLKNSSLVITNDTGPRHIAIALKARLVTLFGPNNPQWTNTGYPGEIQIVGKGDCVPCDKPICEQPQHYCMDSITVDMVVEHARHILRGGSK